MTQSLDGKSVLVVEDEIIIGMMLCKEIASAGGTAIGPVASVAAAFKAIGSCDLDAVVLDAKLIDGSADQLAALLGERGIPFMVSSGYEETSLPDGLRGAVYVAKPISVPLLVEAIDRLVSASGRRVSKVAASGASDRVDPVLPFGRDAA
jgi:DNA-binding response OmpR family regulator